MAAARAERGRKRHFVSELGAIVGSTLFSLPERLIMIMTYLRTCCLSSGQGHRQADQWALKEATAAPPAAGGWRAGSTGGPARQEKDDSPAPAKPAETRGTRRRRPRGTSSSEAVEEGAGGKRRAATKSDAQPVRWTRRSEKKPSGLQSGPQAHGRTPETKEPKIPSNSSISGLTFSGLTVISPPRRIQDRRCPMCKNSSMKTLFLGGGAYCFQRHIQARLSEHRGRRAEIDPNVTRANYMATGLPRDSRRSRPTGGDARQFVELHQDTKEYDLIFGDAFNDFRFPGT